MLIEKDNDGKEGASDSVTTVEDSQKLSEQVEQLNKGIASERSARKTVEESAKQTAAELASLKEELEGLKKSQGSSSDEVDDLSDADKKRLDKWVKEQGFVTAEEVETEKARIQEETVKTFETQAVNDFLAKHPEYDDEAMWNKVKSEFSLYNRPNTLKGFEVILGKIHKELKGDTTDDDAEARAKAKIKNKELLGAGGGTQSAAVDGEVTVEDLQKKYPNLSKEQIEKRLADIKALYPEKK